MANIPWKIASKAAGIASGKASTVLSATEWKTFSSKTKPKKDDYTAPIKEVLIATVLTSAIGAAIGVIFERKVAQILGIAEKQVDKTAE